MSEDERSEDAVPEAQEDVEFEDGDGPGGESDVEVMEAPQLDDEDAVKISHTEDPADDPDEEQPAVGHEAEAVMAEEDEGDPVHRVTTQVPPVVEGALSAEEAEESDQSSDPDESEES